MTGMPQGVKTVLMWAIGLGILALTLVILLIIFGNLSGNLGFDQSATDISNETITLTSVVGGDTPASAENKVNGVISGVVMINASDETEILNSDNYSVSGVIITGEADSEYNASSVNVSYTITADTQAKLDTEDVITNYSTSAVNTAVQFPTVGTILGIAILLVVLIGILVFAIAKMMKAAGGASIGGKSSSFKGSSNAEFG